MPTTPEAIVAAITDATATGFRGRLIARGQARAMIWRDGVLPADAPAFAPQLSFDLHSYGYGLLGLGLRLLEMGGDASQARIAFEQAATALESVMARGDRQEADRHFHFVMAAASYHLAHLSARAYSLLAFIAADENFSPIEHALARLMRRDITRLRAQVYEYRIDGQGSDARIAALIRERLGQEDAADQPDRDGHDFLFEGVDLALTDNFFGAFALFLLALDRGDRALVNQAIAQLRESLAVCADAAGLTLQNVEIEVRDWSSAIALVREGAGVSLVPESTLPEQHRGFRVLKLASPLHREFGLVASQVRPLSRAGNLFVDVARRSIAPTSP